MFFFGILEKDNISILVNYILLESEYFIYRRKLNKGSLCMRLLVDKSKKSFQTERFLMVIKLSGVQFGLKSYAWFQTKIAQPEVQLPLC